MLSFHWYFGPNREQPLAPYQRLLELHDKAVVEWMGDEVSLARDPTKRYVVSDSYLKPVHNWHTFLPVERSFHFIYLRSRQWSNKHIGVGDFLNYTWQLTSAGKKVNYSLSNVVQGNPKSLQFWHKDKKKFLQLWLFSVLMKAILFIS